jgi:hypothetical protein
MLGDSSAKGQVTLSKSEKEAVRQQLGRLLASSYFSHSKRFPSFLGFVVEQTLVGQAANIKERTLGIEIFGRDANYDTSSDPIVRVTATEIRKRVAQYYEDPARGDELRIALPSGSYIPHFYWPNGANGSDMRTMVIAAAEETPIPSVDSDSTPPRPRRHSSLVLAVACVVAGILSVGSLLAWQTMNRSAQSFFWGPITTASDPVLFCMADQLQNPAISLRDAADPTHQLVLKDNLTAVVFDDVSATIAIAEILQATGKQYTIRGEGITNFRDLQAGPTIFIGAFDNAWTLRLTNSLRYHFSNDPQMTQFRIVDSTAPLNRRWVVNRSTQMASNSYRDYAIVARFTDSDTGKVEVIVAGIGSGGTTAAAKFLTDSGNLAQVQRAAQAAGDKTNMELVLSTQIVNGESGSPKIEAAYFW